MTEPSLLAAATEATARRLSKTLEEPKWLLDERLDAVSRVADLPNESNTLWTTYLDLRALRFGEVEPWAEVRGAPTAAQASVPDGAAGLLHVRDDAIVALALAPEARAKGVFLGTFAEARRSRPDVLRAAIEGGRSLPLDDRFGQISRSIASLGILLHVPAGVALDGPIVLRWSVSAPGRALVSRTVVVLGAGARASLFEELVAPDGNTVAPDAAQSQWWGTMETSVGEGATLDVAGEQDLGDRTAAFVTRQATLAADASVRWALAQVGGLFVKSRTDNHLVGNGSRVQQAEIAFGSGAQLFDLSSYTRHVGTDTTGDLLMRGVFGDRARGHVKGLITIERSARGTDSYLGEFGMLLSKKARSVTIPSLEIDQPNVRRASHASSVAPIDEGQVFYFMTRGVPEDVARKAITLAFLEPVVARIPLPAAQERLRDLLEAKWSSARGTTAVGAAA
ncbi:MAG: SufB/SufD family protein [Candidatus Limnocylindrales bacterium]